MNKENVNVHMIGHITDKITYKDGRVEVIEGHNLVVNSFLKLIMSLLKGNNQNSGAKYWAVGSGSSSWDNTPIDPKITETKLTAEIGRKAISSSDISFLDEKFNVVSTPTNILQIVVKFNESECNGSWREFGIFGGESATSTKNSGIMINKRHHALLTKTNEMVVERTMRFTLNLV